ncbi:carbohydrate ABC transporter permease [Paenibacillus roseipurpureus]|uniref:Carbohydrate ABC transporter permease n=1 Tax=Paenibacillus roseopurpureus TaxID=2918901 RepID=A0AA96RJR4_9BACL|nr:carbohydrate ABC transporter permease [Paenibacillus sp. MBLB1832]WNR45678.1 carbohydrate ABC transporter permease [Paenibacillus sp. MBLB1832]
MTEAGTSRWSRALIYALLLICSLAFLFPLFATLSSSLNPRGSMPSLLPKAFNYKNYVDATTMIDFWKYLRNSFVINAISVFTSTFSSGLVGYAFSRIQAPGRKLLFMLILSTMMLPNIVIQIPTYILLQKYGLLNSFYPWLIWGIGGTPFFIFLYRQFFSTIPKELEEAARMDGCSIFRTYWNIFLPLSIPVMVTVAIMNFQEKWGDAIVPFMFLKQAKYPLATALTNIGYTVQGNSELIVQEVTAAGSFLFMLPVIVVFFFGQRYLVEGTVSAGVKG